MAAKSRKNQTADVVLKAPIGARQILGRTLGLFVPFCGQSCLGFN
jgi:hypothetical protein